MARGRPQLFVKRHPLNVLVSSEDYEALRIEAAAIGTDQPGFSVGDLVRTYIAQGLGSSFPRRRPQDAKTERVRQLRSIARSALRLADEIRSA